MAKPERKECSLRKRGLTKHTRRSPSPRSEADARSRLGDWEDDAVVGPAPACPVTMTDRASRLLVGGRARAHSSAEVAKVEVQGARGPAA